MQRFTLHAIPTPNSRNTSVVGADIDCWIDFQHREAAELIARYFIERDDWLVDTPVGLEPSIDDDPERNARVMEAKRDGASFVFSLTYAEPSPLASDEVDGLGDFNLDGLEIRCPHCDNEMVSDGNSLLLAKSSRGVMMDCGSCRSITQWRFSRDPFRIERTPLMYGTRI